jgi:hypothetical protein
MNDNRALSGDGLVARAEQLQDEINYYMTNGREFGEVKLIYQEYKAVLAQLKKLEEDTRHAPFKSTDEFRK